MHTHSLGDWEHSHVFLGERHDRHERRTWLVVALTAATMIAEIVGGTIFGSMALLADGWHMSTHAAALAISAFAYRFARIHARNPRFSFGTGKVGELAGFSSALILGLIALLIGYESMTRLFAPVPIRFGEAAVVAFIGLVVNIASAALLFDSEHHHHHAEEDGAPGGAEAHGHHHHGHGGDANIRAAYLHVLADLVTSVLAIAALLGGRVYGWAWLDPAIGVIGALVIARWSWGLLRSAGAVLLDAVPSERLAASLRQRLEIEGDRVSDLHLWRLGPGHTGVTLAIVSDHPQPPAIYKKRLAGIEGLSHVTVEVQACSSGRPSPPASGFFDPSRG